MFYVNVPRGIIAAAFIWWSYRDQPRSVVRPPVDIAGAVLLSGSIVLVLLGLFDLGEPAGLPLLGGAALRAIALVWVERRAVDPIFPIRLFGQRTFAAACGQGLAAGFAMFGCISFVPLYARAVLGSDATGAGVLLMPMMLGWVCSAIVAGRLMMRFAFRTLAIGGMVLLVVGSAVLALLGAGAPQPLLVAALACMGIGMGQAIPSFLLAVQSSVARSDMGSATSAIQFTRSIGGALGVSVMGVALAAQLDSLLRERGLAPGSIDLDAALEPATAGAAASGALIGEAIVIVFVIAWIAAVLALLATLVAPGGRVSALRRPDAPPAEAG
jgi:Na+/melibiose symporter-like transporter